MSTPANAKRKADEDDSPKPSQKGAKLPDDSVEYLRAWIMSPEHIENPYPTEEEKAKIMEDTGMSVKQVTQWFSNNRKRYWKPKVEEMGRHDLVEAAFAGNGFPPQTTEYLKRWMFSPEHVQNPFPTEEEKVEIMADTGIAAKQLSQWFSNNRKRYWQPKMERLRKEYGLGESDPLPAALLVTASAPSPPPEVVSHNKRQKVDKSFVPEVEVGCIAEI